MGIEQYSKTPVAEYRDRHKSIREPIQLLLILVGYVYH